MKKGKCICIYGAEKLDFMQMFYSTINQQTIALWSTFLKHTSNNTDDLAKDHKEVLRFVDGYCDTERVCEGDVVLYHKDDDCYMVIPQHEFEKDYDIVETQTFM